MKEIKDFLLKKSLNKNRIDDFTDTLVNIMKYSDSEVQYPNIEDIKSDDGVVAEWFYPIFNGKNDFSELTAIHSYVGQEAMFEDLGELFLGIALTEMKHYAKLSDFILKIGGKISQKYDTSEVKYGINEREAVQIAIRGEEKTVDFYEKLQEKLLNLEETSTIIVALQLLAKLVADENVHLKLLKEVL